MTEIGKLVDNLRANKPGFAEAEAVVDLVRKVGDLLEEMRLRKNLTQEQLAQRLDMSAGRISQLESGTLRDAPSLKNLARFATVCGETIDVVALGGRTQAADAQLDRSAEILKELTQLRQEFTAPREQDRSGEIVEELRSLRQEVAALREVLNASQSTPELHYEPYSIDQQIKVQLYGAAKRASSPPTKHRQAVIMMNDLTPMTLHSCGLATQSVMAAAGFPTLKVSAVEPVMSGNGVKVMVTMTPQRTKGSET